MDNRYVRLSDLKQKIKHHPEVGTYISEEDIDLIERRVVPDEKYGEWLIPLTDEPWRKGYHGKCSVCGYTYSYNTNKMPKRCDCCDSKMRTES